MKLAHLPAGRFIYGHSFLKPFEFTSMWASAEANRGGAAAQTAPASPTLGAIDNLDKPKLSPVESRDWRWAKTGSRAEVEDRWTTKKTPRSVVMNAAVAEKENVVVEKKFCPKEIAATIAAIAEEVAAESALQADAPIFSPLHADAPAFAPRLPGARGQGERDVRVGRGSPAQHGQRARRQQVYDARGQEVHDGATHARGGVHAAVVVLGGAREGARGRAAQREGFRGGLYGGGRAGGVHRDGDHEGPRATPCSRRRGRSRRSSSRSSRRGRPRSRCRRRGRPSRSGTAAGSRPSSCATSTDAAASATSASCNTRAAVGVGFFA